MRDHSFAFIGFSENEPVTVLPASMVGRLPFGIYDRAFSRLDDAVARAKASLSCGVYEIDVRPVVTMVMDVVRNLAEQDTLWCQHAVRLRNKRWIRVGEGIAVLFWRADDKPESHVEILFVILTLIRNVGWVVHHDVESVIPERHPRVVGRDVRPM